jgi:hypothetical protein
MPPTMPRPSWRLARSGAAANSPPTPIFACWSSRRPPARGAAKSSAPFCGTGRQRRRFRVFAGSSAQPGCAGAGGTLSAALARRCTQRAGTRLAAFHRPLPPTPRSPQRLQSYMRALRRFSLGTNAVDIGGFHRPAMRRRVVAGSVGRAHDPGATPLPICAPPAKPARLGGAGSAAAGRASLCLRPRFHKRRVSGPPPLAQAVESCGSLGFDGRRISWKDFLSQLGRALDETLFAPESRDAPIQIAGPAESAGLTADAVWFLGADEDAWPAAGTTHPLLPPEFSARPECPTRLRSSIGSWLARSPTACWPPRRGPLQLCKAERGRRGPSFAADCQLPGKRRSCRRSCRACRRRGRSPFIRGFQPHSLPAGQGRGRRRRSHRAVAVSLQSLRHRAPGAQGWEPAEAGLTRFAARQLLHAVLHCRLGGPPDGIRSHAELLSLGDREAFVAGHVQRVLARELRPHLARSLCPPLSGTGRAAAHKAGHRVAGLRGARVAFEVPRPRPSAPFTLQGSISTCAWTASTG